MLAVKRAMTRWTKYFILIDYVLFKTIWYFHIGDEMSFFLLVRYRKKGL